MLMGVPARGRELAGFIMRFASPGGAPLPLDLSLMPVKLLFALGKSPAQMPLYPGSKPFGLEIGLFHAQLDKHGRPTMGAAVLTRASGSGFAIFKPASGITGGHAVLRTRGRSLAKNNIAYGQRHKYRGGKQQAG